MAENILYKEEISASILKLSNHVDQAVNWNEFVHDMKEFIIANYDGRALTTYKGDWKRHFKQTLKLLNRKYGRCTEEAWSQIIDTVLRADKSSTSTRTSNRQISEEEKRVVIEIFNNIKDSDKWVLSTGKIVDDIMRVCVEESFYEHPVHSLILDPSDLIWKKHFTVSELKEISAVNTRPLDEIPSELQQYINSYTACKTAMDLRKYVFSHCFDPIEEFDKKWVQESILAASNLFNYNKLLDTSDYSEADLLHRIWPFVYNLFQDNEIKAKLGERCSVAVAVFKNGNRSLETNEKRPRKNMGAKLDILFKCGSVEVGSSEVGKDDVIEADDKYFDDGLVKLPKTLRDMLAALVRKNPAQINGLTTVGYLMMGLSRELVIMDVPVGCSITRVRKSSKYDFPENIESFAVDLIPLLELAWKGKELMKKTMVDINSRKRKSVDISIPEDDILSTLPSSFYSCNSTKIN